MKRIVSTHEAHGKRLVVKFISRGNYHMQIDGQARCRWASFKHQIAEDVAYFMEWGALPPQATPKPKANDDIWRKARVFADVDQS